MSIPTNLSIASVKYNGVSIPLDGSGGATQHTIHLEFSDGTDTDIEVDYDDSLIATMITSYTPETYGQKTVDSAALDGVTWYTKPTEVWETIWDESTQFNNDPDFYPYCWITSLADVAIPIGSQWRVTFEGTTYLLVGHVSSSDSSYGEIGNPMFGANGTDDGSGVPFALYQTPWGAWSGSADVAPDSYYALKIERLVMV